MAVWEGEGYLESSFGQVPDSSSVRASPGNPPDFSWLQAGQADATAGRGRKTFAASDFPGKLPAGQRMLIIAVAALLLWSALLAALRAAA